MATENKSTTVRLKSSAQDVSSKPKTDSLGLKKKVGSPSRHPSDSKMKSATTVTKSQVKSKQTTTTTSSSSKTITKTTTTKVRERKVYTLPGQKHDPPEQKEPLRIFYESLSKQIPTSEMAEFWYNLCSVVFHSSSWRGHFDSFSIKDKQFRESVLMEHGLLSLEKAKRAFEKKQRKQKELRTGTPVKLSKPPTKTQTSQKQQQGSKKGDIKAKKRIDIESDDDDDFILSHKRRKG